MIIKRRSRLLVVEKVIMLSVIVPFFNVERYASALVEVIERLGCDFVRVDHCSSSRSARLMHRFSHAP